MTSQKPLLILDIDETLVFASEERRTNYDFQWEKYFVVFRPGLATFLREVSERYLLAVWSSSSDDYAEAIAEHLRPADIKFEFVWGRSRCTRKHDLELGQVFFQKRLDKLKRRGFRKDQMLIVDNTPRKVRANYGNAIYVRDFEGDLSDTELPRLARFLREISSEEDFRTIEKRGWRRRYE